MAESGVSTSMTVAGDMEKGSTSRGSTFDEKKDENVAVVDVKDEKEGNAAEVLTFPEGGFHAWAAVASAFSSTLLSGQDWIVRPTYVATISTFLHEEKRGDDSNDEWYPDTESSANTSLRST